MIKAYKSLFLTVITITIGCLGLGTVVWANPGELQWKYSSSGGYGEWLAIDSFRNRILVTTFQSSTTHYWHVVSLDKNGKLNWQTSYIGGETQGVATDSRGNVIVVGYEYNGSDDDWKVISYSPAGEINWQQSYDGTFGHDIPRAVAVDSKDDVIVVGSENNGSDDDWKIISYSPLGTINWQQSYDGGNGDDTAYAVGVDSDDNVIVAGRVRGGSDDDWKIISFSALGGINWQRSYDGRNGDDSPHKIAVDSKDNVIVAGYEHNGSDVDWKVISYSSTGATNWEGSYDSGSGDEEALNVSVDSNGNAVVVGTKDAGCGSDWHIISYSPSGAINWQQSYSGNSNDWPLAVASDSDNNAVVAGFEKNDRGDYDWRIISFSSAGDIEWKASYDSRNGTYETSSYKRGKGGVRSPASGNNYDDWATRIAIDKVSGEVVVAGSILNKSSALVIDCQGYTPKFSGHVLIPSEVRTVQPAAQTPNATPDNGTYLGFGDVVANGTHFKVEAAFPAYLKQSDNTTLPVKIFIAAQMPDDYSRLAYFDSSNNLKYQPPDKLLSWKSSVTGEVAKTTIFPEVDVHSGLSGIATGTHYWYTLVVPATVPDDFSGVDWSTTPWEITVNVFEVK